MKLGMESRTPAEIGRDIVAGKRRRKLLKRLTAEQNHRCAYCGQRFGDAGSESRATIEHVQAKAHGGLDSWENCVAACAGCNSARGCIQPSKFMRRVQKGFYAALSRPSTERGEANPRNTP